MSHNRSFGRVPAVVAVLLAATAGFVAVACVVQAIRLDSWEPIWSIGWLPAVVVASLWAPASGRSCLQRVRGPAGR